MVQNCCSTCMSCIGQFVCKIFCCNCCCCRRKEQLRENQQNGELKHQTVLDFSPEDGSIYNGSSTYDSQTIIKPQPYSECGTSGVYMSESSLYSGSKTENQSEIKLEFSSEIKGIIEVEGVPQPVKGVLKIVSDETRKQQLPDKSNYDVNPDLINNVTFHKSSTSKLLNVPQNTKIPKPLPRIHGLDPSKNRDTEKYINNNSSMTNDEKETISEANNEEYYSEPKPPVLVKTRDKTEPVESYVPVYGGNKSSISFQSMLNTVSIKKNNVENTSVSTNSDSKNKTDTDVQNDEQQNEHIYEYIDLTNYQEPYPRKQISSHNISDEKIDNDIYML